MPLKTNVWVNKITTLSEARYCAGMGVQFLGFQPAVVDVKTYRDITGWVSGPSFFLDISEEMTVPAQVADYACEYLLIREEQVNELPPAIDSKLLIKKSLSSSGSTSPTRANFILLENWAPESLERAPGRTVVAVSNPAEALLAISLPIAGILLQGSTEASPGLMEYDHLSAVLELLETED